MGVEGSRLAAAELHVRLPSMGKSMCDDGRNGSRGGGVRRRCMRNRIQAGRPYVHVQSCTVVYSTFRVAAAALQKMPWPV